ncbi:MAG: hypothetical protein U1C74_26480 [Phenylobacterium sp.]|nr:hypothetical protein [Phenylobacterium sp.]
MDVVEADRSEEAWIRTSNSDESIRIRSLTMILQRGAALTEARLIELEDQTWTIWFRLSDRPGEFRLNLAKFDQPKTYKDVALAIATIRDDFGYLGTIFLSTERRPGRTPKD